MTVSNCTEYIRNHGVDSENQPALFDKLVMRNKVLEASYAFSKAVSRELQVEPLCDLMVAQLFDIFQAADAALLFYDEDTEELYVKRVVGDGMNIGPNDRFKRGEGLAGQALEQQTLIAVRWDEQQPGGMGSFESLRRSNSAVPTPYVTNPDGTPAPMGERYVAVAAPLIAESKVKGVVAITWPGGQVRPIDEDFIMLDVLSGVIATALDNSWLYQQITKFNEKLEAKVGERTSELGATNDQLSAALDELRQTQSQLVQQEKMASLGQLTAGIAHEINNPLAFSISNIALAEERLATMELRFRLIGTRLELDSKLTDADKVERGMKMVSTVEAQPDYKEDVSWFRAEARELPTNEQVALLSEFMRYVEVSEEKKVPREELIESFHKLMNRGRDGLDRVKTIVIDLRSFSRLDEANLQTIDIDDGISSALTIVGHLAKDRQIKLSHERGLTAPCTCYPAKLNQVVLNLVTNALQATESGGTVTVRTEETDAGPIIEVRDSGQGIGEDELARIFDPFFTTKPVGQGTGLGLSISYKIVEEHGGQIRVASEMGKGSVFTVQLPPRSH